MVGVSIGWKEELRLFFLNIKVFGKALMMGKKLIVTLPVKRRAKRKAKQSK